MKIRKSYDIEDLQSISTSSDSFIEKFSNSRILVAGASGFVGSWIISSLDYMNKNLAANIQVIGIARKISEDFATSFPQVTFVESSISEASFQLDFAPDCVFNAATPSTPMHGGGDPKQVLAAATIGTRNLLRVCEQSAKATFVNLSSGIVTKRAEEVSLDLSSIKDSYLKGKRISEELVGNADSEGKIQGKNLRLYAFAGPGISLVDHFAVGNFMNDALNHKPIHIKGNPATRRSYLYPTDLVANIFSAAASPIDRSIELGSNTDVSIHEIANLVNEVTGNNGVYQSPKYGPPDSYFPSKNQLLISQRVNLESAIAKWFYWLEKN